MASAELMHDLFAETVAAALRKGVAVADPTPPTGRIYRVNGLNLNLLDWLTRSDKPSMLLLHGALLQSHVWDFVSLALRADFHIRALDLPGHGESDWAPDADYSRSRVATDLVSLIEQLDLRSLVLVGHSFGGAVSALVAAHIPDRIRALVMIDSTLMLIPGRANVRARAAELPEVYASFDELARHAVGLGRPREGARSSASLRWNARQRADGRWTWKYDPAVRHAPLGPSDFHDVWDALGAYAGPVLFVRAGEDSHLSEEAAKRLQVLPNLQLVTVPGARHNVMTDNPIALQRELKQFNTSKRRSFPH